MNATLTPMIDFDITADFEKNALVNIGSQVGAIAGKVATSTLIGISQLALNAVGYTARAVGGVVQYFSPELPKPLPATTPFLQMVDNGTSLLDHLGYVGMAAAHGLYDGGVSLYKFGANFITGKFEEAKEHGTEALTFLLSMKIGETVPLWNKAKLKVKQMAFDLQQMSVGIINRSGLEFLKKGPEGQPLLIKKESVPNITDPTAPPKEVTTVLKPEQVAQECADSLRLNLDGSVEFRSPFEPDPVCFVAGTLVHTKDGLKPIEQIKVGDYVLSRPDSGEGEQAHKRVTKIFVSEDQEVWLVDYILLSDGISHSLVVTENHPLWVVGAGWTAVKDVKAGDEFELFDHHDIKRYGCVYRVLRIFETDVADVGWTYDYFDRDVKGPTIDLRDGLVRVSQARTEDVYNVTAFEMGEYLKRRVFNIEVEDFHTYYVGEVGVWVHNACLPQVAGTVEAKRVVLNNAVEANAGLTPDGNALVEQGTDHGLSVHKQL